MRKISARNGTSIVIIFCVLYLIYLNIPHTQKYTLDIGSKNDNNPKDPISINASIMDGPYYEEKIDYRSFNNTSAHIYMRPKSRIWENQELVVRAKVKSDEKLNFSVRCPECKEAENKSANSFDPIFYLPHFQDYLKVESFDDNNVYVKKEIAKNKKFKSAWTFNKWLEKNSIIGNYTIGSVDYDPDFTNFIAKQDIENKQYETEVMVRGDITFIAYFKDKIDISIEKKDLNWYEGEDRVKVTVISLTDQKEIAETIIEDDSTGNLKEGAIQKATIIEENIKEGPYKIVIEEVRDSNGEGKSDFIINRLFTNTNKIVTKGKVSLTGKKRLYYNIPNNVNISGFIWTNAQIQNLWINSDNKIAELTERDVGVLKKIELPSGERNLLVENSIEVDLGEKYFAFSKESLFNPYLLDSNSGDPTDIILSKLDITDNKNGWVTVEKKVKIKDLMKFLSINSTRLKNLENLIIILYGPDAGEKFSFKGKIEQDGYHHLSSYGDVHIFSESRRDDISINQYGLFKTLGEWIRNYIPINSDIGTIDFTPSKKEFVNKYIEHTRGETIIAQAFNPQNTKLIGYFHDSIEIETVEDEPEQNIRVLVKDLNQKVLIDDTLPIAKELKDIDIEAQLVYLDFSKNDEGTIIENLKINSREVSFIEELELSKPSEIYFSSQKGQTISVKLLSSRDSQNIRIGNSSYILDETNTTKWQNIYLPSGIHTLQNDKPLLINMNYGYPQVGNTGFIPFNYSFSQFYNQEYLIVEKKKPSINLDKITLSVK